MSLSRRQFLKHTITAAAACGLAQPSIARNTHPETITDTHVYLGHWPHQQLPSDNPTRLVADLRQSGVSQAWVGSFDGLFHKNVASVNQRLAEACTQIGGGILIPFGTINPTLPDWEDDIRRCHETLHTPGIRLHPNYHGYALDDPRFARLLDLVVARGLIVQLVVWMEEERHLLLNSRAADVNLKPLADKVSPLSRLKLIVTNYAHAGPDESMRALFNNENVYFDFARTSGTGGIKQLIEAASTKRVVFGSGAPLHSVEAPMAKLSDMKLTDDVCQLIASTNAAALLSPARKTSAVFSGSPGYEIVNTQ